MYSSSICYCMLYNLYVVTLEQVADWSRHVTDWSLFEIERVLRSITHAWLPMATLHHVTLSRTNKQPTWSCLSFSAYVVIERKSGLLYGIKSKAAICLPFNLHCKINSCLVLYSVLPSYLRTLLILVFPSSMWNVSTRCYYK